MKHSNLLHSQQSQLQPLLVFHPPTQRCCIEGSPLNDIFLQQLSEVYPGRHWVVSLYVPNQSVPRFFPTSHEAAANGFIRFQIDQVPPSSFFHPANVSTVKITVPLQALVMHHFSHCHNFQQMLTQLCFLLRLQNVSRHGLIFQNAVKGWTNPLYQLRVHWNQGTIVIMHLLFGPFIYDWQMLRDAPSPSFMISFFDLMHKPSSPILLENFQAKSPLRNVKNISAGAMSCPWHFRQTKRIFSFETQPDLILSGIRTFTTLIDSFVSPPSGGIAYKIIGDSPRVLHGWRWQAATQNRKSSLSAKLLEISAPYSIPWFTIRFFSVYSMNTYSSDDQGLPLKAKNAYFDVHKQSRYSAASITRNPERKKTHHQTSWKKENELLCNNLSEKKPSARRCHHILTCSITKRKTASNPHIQKTDRLCCFNHHQLSQWPLHRPASPVAYMTRTDLWNTSDTSDKNYTKCTWQTKLFHAARRHGSRSDNISFRVHPKQVVRESNVCQSGTCMRKGRQLIKKSLLFQRISWKTINGVKNTLGFIWAKQRENFLLCLGIQTFSGHLHTGKTVHAQRPELTSLSKMQTIVPTNAKRIENILGQNFSHISNITFSSQELPNFHLPHSTLLNTGCLANTCANIVK